MKVNSIGAVQQPKSDKNTKKKVTVASVAGSAVGIAGTVAGIYMAAKKGNPAVKLSNLSYSEVDAFLLGTSAIVGGLAGGLIADDNKENVTPKLREATQQLIGNTLLPIGILAVANKLLAKSGLKMPQINSTSAIAKFANNALNTLPKAVVTVASLMGGMEIGNKIVNKVNNKVFKEEVKHDVHPEDYLVHADDLCLTLSMIFKDTKSISSITSKALPLTFLVSGAKTGMQQKEV